MTRRVLYFDTTGQGGGSNASLLTLLNHLDTTRYQPIVVLGSSPDPRWWSTGRAEHLSLGRLDNYDFFPAAPQLPWIYHFLLWLVRLPGDVARARRLLRRIRPDLVHINTGQALAFGFASRLARIPAVWHIRELLARNALGRWQQDVYGYCARVVIANSRAVAARLPRIADRVAVVHNAVDVVSSPGPTDSSFRRTLGLPNDAFVVLLLGGLSRNKGAFFLAEVARGLEAHPIYFVLAGEHREAPASPWHRLARRVYRGLSGRTPEHQRLRGAWADVPRVLFPGVVRAPEAIAACDLVVCPNTCGESFGRTVIEANAQGKLALTSTVEPFDETIVEGRNGWRLPLEVTAWRRRLEDLAAHPERLRALAGEARACAQRYEAAAHARQIMSVYDHVLGDAT